jgi:hypothetical protein
MWRCRAATRRSRPWRGSSRPSAQTALSPPATPLRQRRAIELSLGDADVVMLSSMAQSRTEPAGRVERARILLGYWKDPSFFAVGQALGLHHQTVQS